MLEVVVGGIVGGLVGAALIYITFRLGQWESDRKWKRELTQREKERIEREQRETVQRRISILTEALTALEEYLAFSSGSEVLQPDEWIKVKVRAAGKAWYARALFSEEQFPTLNETLGNLINCLQGPPDGSGDLASWENQGKEEEEMVPEGMAVILQTIRELDETLAPYRRISASR